MGTATANRDKQLRVSRLRWLVRHAPIVVWLVVFAGVSACGPVAARPTPTVELPSGVLGTPARSGPLQLTITAPADNTVVSEPQVILTGLAPSETVVTINDNLLVVDVTGQFSTTVPLQEGPNELDVLASDSDGNQVSTKLVVTYDPAQ